MLIDPIDAAPLQFILLTEHEMILQRETAAAYTRGHDRCEIITEHEPDWRVEQAQRILAAVERLRTFGESGMDRLPGESAFQRAIDLIDEAAKV